MSEPKVRERRDLDTRVVGDRKSKTPIQMAKEVTILVTPTGSESGGGSIF